MTEIQGTLESYNENNNNISLSDSIIIVNRAVADLATTFNDIVQYKYSGDTFGSTLSTPLGPLFNNENEKSVVHMNILNQVLVPLYNNTDNKVGDDGEPHKGIALKDAMVPYIKAVYEQFNEMSKYFLDDNKVSEPTENIVE